MEMGWREDERKSGVCSFREERRGKRGCLFFLCTCVAGFLDSQRVMRGCVCVRAGRAGRYVRRRVFVFSRESGVESGLDASLQQKNARYACDRRPPAPGLHPLRHGRRGHRALVSRPGRRSSWVLQQQRLPVFFFAGRVVRLGVLNHPSASSTKAAPPRPAGAAGGRARRHLLPVPDPAGGQERDR